MPKPASLPRRRVALPVLLLAYLCFKLAVGLRAETTSYSGATEITALPCVITTPGTYYLTHDFNVNVPGDSRIIAVYTANVTVDFNGHTVTNTAGSANGAYAMFLSGQNITVRHGALAGSLTGIFLEGTCSGIVLEDMRLNSTTSVGVFSYGSDVLIRRCQFIGLGGTTCPGYGSAFGILAGGTGTRVVDCDFAALVGNPASNSAAVLFNYTSDGLVQGNRISRAYNGIIYLNGSTGKYRDNLCAGSVTTPYTSGTDAGGNN